MFPLVSKYQGQTVIVRGQDGNFVPSVSSKADDDKDVGIPQIYYCHNVLPTPQGLAAVAFEQKKEPQNLAVFRKVLNIRSDSGDVGSIGIAVGSAKLYYTDPDRTVWLELSVPDSTTLITEATVAYVAGVSYLFLKGIGLYTLDFSTLSLTKQTMLGLAESELIGVVSNSGYLIAFSANSVAWSSTLDPLDFVPDLETGAGGGGVEGVRGQIVACTPAAAGFLIYTTVNAVAASYSGNSRFPFNFREIVGCGGLESLELAASDGASGLQYAYTSFGLQGVSFQQGQLFLPEVTDFISGSYFEDFEDSTEQFSYQQLTAPMQKKLVLIAGRYLVLSYGVSSLTHALVYDIGLKRLGKIKCPHVDVYDFAQAGNSSVEAAKQSLAFLQADGRVVLASVDYGRQGQ
jgi:hypothetical protein